MAELDNENAGNGLEIAVIGMSGRFPGAATLEKFWENLKNGVESIRFYTREELAASGMALEWIQDPSFVPANAVLENCEYFDAPFFGYTPDEARMMDPQMRLFHECVWQALEDAAYDPEWYHGLIGLFAGAAENTNWKFKTAITGGFDSFTESLLTNKGLLSTRMSYKFNLKGPSASIYTACSTSLLAIHLACRSLLSGECDMAVAGGVSVDSSSARGYMYQEGMILSADGHCRAFDARASGTIFGNGVGAVVLKPLEDALLEGDHIYAVIIGSAVNNDGNRKVGYTAPSVQGQAEVVSTALQVAGIEPESITYIETHGTGTSLGDPIEIKALVQAFNTEKKGYCKIGSVKSNIGHLDAAAGIASFIKTLLAFKHRMLPPSLHFEKANPEIDFVNSPFVVNTLLTPWNGNGYPLRAGVSSFGFGGTNVHILLEETPPLPTQAGKPGKPQLILLSARTESALKIESEHLHDYLQENPGVNLEHVAYTLQVGRRVFEFRQMMVADNYEELEKIFSDPHSPQRRSFLAKSKNPPVIFMFSGQGAQYVNMGRELYFNETEFRETMDYCLDRLKYTLDGMDLKHILYPGETGEPGVMNSGAEMIGEQVIDQTSITQPVLFAFEYALARLLMKWGIKPHGMMGHSIGEYVAACLAGVFSLDEALEIVSLRGKLMQRMPYGTMVSVGCSEEEIKTLLPSFLWKNLSLAAVNTPGRCVVSGPKEVVEDFEREASAKGFNIRRLHTSHAFHSGMMDPILDTFKAAVCQVGLKKPVIPYISNVTGTWITEQEATDPGYWSRQLREAVRFSDGLEEIFKKKNAVLVEVGPGKNLVTFATQHPHKKEEHRVVSLIPHPREAAASSSYVYFLSKIGELWLYDVKSDWLAFHEGEERFRLSLPVYPFEGQRYWIDGDPMEMGAEMMTAQSKTLGKKKLDDWFYVPQWLRSIPAPSDNGKISQSAALVVFCDEEGVGDWLVNMASQEEKIVVRVKPGDCFKKESDAEYTIHPGKAAHYQELLKSLVLSRRVPGKVIHLWSVVSERGGEESDSNSREMVNQSLESGFMSVLYLAQAMGSQVDMISSEWVVVSTGMHDVLGGEAIRPAISTVLSAVKTIPQEYSGIICRSIDIVIPREREEKETFFHHLWQEIQCCRGDKVVALRARHRWVQRFEPVRLESFLEAKVPFIDRGVYWITGGMGGIGLVMAEFLAQRYQARLVLTGRSLFPSREQWPGWLNTHDNHDKISLKIRKIMELEKYGAQILVMSADTGNIEHMQAVVAQVFSSFGEIHGVIHAAGAFAQENFSTIADFEQSHLDIQLNSKVYGVMVLAKVLQQQQPGFCLLMSSLSAVLGGIGFSAYAAANIFMDSMVQEMNRLNQGHWLSINWDAWQLEETTGQGSGPGAAMAQFSVSPAEGILALLRILGWGESCRVVHSTGDLDSRIHQWIDLDTVHGNETPADLHNVSHQRPPLPTPYVPPVNELQKSLARIWGKLFGFQEVGIHDDFFELGGDSLRAMTLLANIHKELKVKIPLPDFFNAPTLKGMSEFIAGASRESYTDIEPVEKKEFYPLSSAQKRLFMIQQADLSSTAYNMPEVVELGESVESMKLEKTFQLLIGRHESLRTSFPLLHGEPIQRIHEAVDVEFNVEFYGAQPFSDVFQRFVRPFDLSQAPLLRAAVLQAGEKRYMLLTDIHHIISDAVSSTILIQDFATLYHGGSLSPIRLQYKDYSEWQNLHRVSSSSNLKRQEEYWLKKFQGELPVLELPTDFPRPETRGYHGDSVRFKLALEPGRALKQMASQESATLFMALMAVFDILLARLSGQEDIIVGTVTAGRGHADLGYIIGMFVNTVVTRAHARGDLSFRDFLIELNQAVLTDFENQDYQFEELVDKLSFRRDIRRNPIFDVMFTFQSSIDSMQEEEPEPVEEYNVYQFGSKFDLALVGEERKNSFSMEMIYSTALFKRETIEKFAGYFNEIVTAVAADPGILIKDISLSQQWFDEKIIIPQAYGDFQF